MDQLPKCAANYVPLTPITFLKRAASAYSDRKSLIYGATRFTWKQTYERCCRVASSLQMLNVVKNDVVSVLAPNVPALYEMHFAVPMAGAVLNTINTRLDPGNIATILKHSEAKVFFVDYQFVPEAKEALRLLTAGGSNVPLVILIDDMDPPKGIRLGELEYEELVHKGHPGFIPAEVQDEWDAISLNYTSGTTSDPKGVVYSHRGAYLSTLSLILQWEMKSEPVYMWSLPMFHCNGWTFTWGVAARGGTNVCIRNTCAADMYQAISEHKVTHMCCAPIVFNILLDAKPHESLKLTSQVEILTGGAPPPAPLLEKIERLGFHVTHAYGLTEATGPALVCEWQAKWHKLPRDGQAKLKARQGLSVLSLADLDVKELKTMCSVPRDGISLGEIVLRGSSIMKGYFKDQKNNQEAFMDGEWFHTGDIGVIHADGYVEIKDRLKDVIISGGENISSVEVETVLYMHPRVSEAAVVAMPHEFYGETPCAFIKLRAASSGESENVAEGEIISFCRKRLPHFMAPRKVFFVQELPKNGTKVLKVQLRALARTYAVNGGSNDSSPCQVSHYYQSQEQVMAMSSL